MFGLARLLRLAGNIAWRLNGAGFKRGLTRNRPARCSTLRLEVLEDRVVPTLLGQQLFPADYPWNQNIANAPVAANSAAIIANIGASIGIHPDWGEASAANGANPLYGIPFNIVHGNTTPRVNVIIDSYASESDILQVPIPPNAVLEGDYQNGPNMNGPGYGAGRRGDSHLIVWDQDNNIVYELFAASRPNDPFTHAGGPTGGVWHAAQESVWNLNANSFRTLSYTSADAAGLTILPGLARPDEGLPASQGGQGAINHALRFTLPAGDVNPQYIYPASHVVNVSAGSANLPFGARLRLMNTPTVNAIISNLGPQAQIVARAMQQYGLVLADIGTAMYVTGSSSAQDANNNITHVWNMDDVLGLRAITAGHFQVVDLTPQVTGLSATTGAAGTVVTITGRNFSGSAGRLSVLFGTAAATSVTLVDDSRLNVVVPGGTGTVHVRVQSGVNAIDPNDPNDNVRNPIFGYGISTTSAADQFTYGAGQTISGTNSTVSFATSTTVSGVADALTIVVKDTAGAAVTGLASGAFSLVLSAGTSAGTFSPVTATATPGTYTANFIGTTAGTASTLTATIGGVTLTNRPTITVTAGGVSGATSTVSFATATVASGGADPLTIVVKDAAGNPISGLAGSAFGFTLSGGMSSGTFGAVTPTATPGVYSAAFTAGVPGTTSTLTAVVNGVTLAARPTVTVISSTTFSDNFSTAGPGQQLASPWITQVGAFQVNTAMRTAIGAAGLNLATVGGISSADEAVSAVVTLAPGQIAGLVARHAGEGDRNMYHGVLIANAGSYSAHIYRNLDGAWTALFGQTYAGSIIDATLEFAVVGSSLRLFLNGAIIGHANDTALTAPGSVGMRATAGAVMKDFRAVPLTLQNSASTTTFSDAFAAPGSNSQLSNFWLNQAGNFQVAGASAIGGGGLNLATVNGIHSAHEAVSATVTLTAGQIAGLVARYSGTGDQNMYHGVLIAGAGSYNAYIFRNLGGAWTALFGQTYAGSVTNATLEFDVVGSSLRLFLNGAVIGYANDTALTAPGSVGMRATAGAVMKNFSASPMTLQNAASMTTFSDNFTTPGSNSQLSNFWFHQAGNFQVGGGSAVGVGGLDLAIVNGIRSANEAVAATVTLAPGQVGGLVARYIGPGDQNMYHGVLIAGAGSYNAYIFRNLGGAWTALYGQTYAGSITNATLEFDVVGSSLRLFLNGALIGHANDTALPMAGSVGMRVTAGAVMKNFIASPITPANQQLPFSDDFTTAGPNAQLTTSWLNQAGNINVAAGAAGGGAGLNLATVNGISAANVTVEADVNLSATGQAAGLVARYAGGGDQNMYVATIMQTGAGVYQVFLHVNVNGAWTLLGSRNVSSGNGTLRLAIQGTSMTVSFGGAALFTVLDSSLSAAGAVGLRLTAGARVDNFSAS